MSIISSSVRHRADPYLYKKSMMLVLKDPHFLFFSPYSFSWRLGQSWAPLLASHWPCSMLHAHRIQVNVHLTSKQPIAKVTPRLPNWRNSPWTMPVSKKQPTLGMRHWYKQLCWFQHVFTQFQSLYQRQLVNNTDSLKAGLGGPTLLEDFMMREKIMHFGTWVEQLYI